MLKIRSLAKTRDELHKIIEEIRPEIIFEELPVNVFRTIYSEGHQPQTLEAITIKKYLQKYPIQRFSVDTYPINEADLFSGAQLIWENSNEYRKLWDENLLRINRKGYSYINSNDVTEIPDKIQTVEKTVLSEINNLKLLSEHKAEKVLDDKREEEMLKNIYHYSEQYPLNKALFICGAQHRGV